MPSFETKATAPEVEADQIAAPAARAQSPLMAEKPECRTCPNREKCHGQRPEVTDETLVRLIAEAVLEVLKEQSRRR